MPTNKNAQIRYRALDRCLGNWNRRFYIEDLVNACNDALTNHNGITKDNGNIKKRQVQADLKFLESEAGYKMSIERIRDGHRKYYRYSKRNDSINNHPINQEEIDLICDAMLILERLQGIPQFEWLDDLKERLYSTSRLKRDNLNAIISFQSNPYLKGMEEYYQKIFEAIINERVIRLEYQPFHKDAKIVVVSPYHLKQHNNRWFLIGKRVGMKQLSNFAIDRINHLEEISNKYEKLDKDFNFEEYYSDVVGISITDTPIQKVVLRLSNEVMGYIKTKPLHESQTQKAVQTEDGRWQISLKVKENYELLSLLRSFGEQIEVIEPESLRQKMKESAFLTHKNYL